MTITDSPKTIDGIALTPKDLGIQGPPVFETVEEERLHRKQRLAGALRIFGRLGFGEGVAGHITVRDPEFPDHFWVNPFGGQLPPHRGQRPHARQPPRRGRVSATGR